MAKLIRKGAAMPNMNAPEAHKEVQSFIKSQIYFKGFIKGVSVGANPDITIQLGGTPRKLYGICLYIQNDKTANDDTFGLTINEEQIITDCIWRAFNPQQTGNFKTNIFFDIPRPLSGNDSVVMNFKATAAMNIYPVFYLSNTP